MTARGLHPAAQMPSCQDAAAAPAASAQLSAVQHCRCLHLSNTAHLPCADAPAAAAAAAGGLPPGAELQAIVERVQAAAPGALLVPMNSVGAFNAPCKDAIEVRRVLLLPSAVQSGEASCPVQWTTLSRLCIALRNRTGP